jgi:hypothetical protein
MHFRTESCTLCVIETAVQITAENSFQHEKIVLFAAARSLIKGQDAISKLSTHANLKSMAGQRQQRSDKVAPGARSWEYVFPQSPHYFMHHVVSD